MGLGESSLSIKLRKDNFVVNEANKEAFETIFSGKNEEPVTRNPIFLFGEHGVGKTHLMQAYGHYLEEHCEGATVLYVTGENFVNDVISIVRSGKTMDPFREKYRKTDYLLIDDIDFLLGKELSTSEMIFTIKDTVLKDKMVVVSSHKDFTIDPDCDEDFKAVFCGWTKVEMRRE